MGILALNILLYIALLSIMYRNQKDIYIQFSILTV